MGLGPLGLIDFDDPPLSLAEGQIELAETFLAVPSGLSAGEPLLLTMEQVEFLWAWYEVSADGRRYVRSRGHLEGPKGWSKSPLGLVVTFGELVGDVVPDGLDASGRPVGRPHPLPNVQVAGVSLEGAENLYGQFFHALKDSAAVPEFGLDVGLTRTTRNGGGEVAPVTASSASRTGNPVSAILQEETWLWTPSNGGVALAQTLGQNATKMRARVLSLTNTPVPGQASVAESAVRSFDEGGARRQGRTLMVRIRLPEKLPDIHDDDAAFAALEQLYGSHAVHRGGWVDLDEILDDRPPGQTTEDQWRRLFLSEDASADDAVLDPVAWDLLIRPDARLTIGETVALGFDGSDGGDACALYAVRWPDWCLFKIGVWERPRDQLGRPVLSWTLPRQEVLDVIVETLDRYNVVMGFADPAYWQTDIDALHAVHGDGFQRFAHHTNTKIGPAGERWTSLTTQPDTPLGWAPDPDAMTPGISDLVRHAAAARRERVGPATSKWWRPARRVQGQPIDALSAAITAVHALGEAVAAGKVNEDEGFEAFAY